MKYFPFLHDFTFTLLNFRLDLKLRMKLKLKHVTWLTNTDWILLLYNLASSLWEDIQKNCLFVLFFTFLLFSGSGGLTSQSKWSDHYIYFGVSSLSSWIANEDSSRVSIHWANRMQELQSSLLISSQVVQIFRFLA